MLNCSRRYNLNAFSVSWFRCSSLLVRSPRTGDSLMDTTNEEHEGTGGNTYIYIGTSEWQWLEPLVPCVDWCPSDGEENNRSRSNSEKSDSDTSHIDINDNDSEDDEVYEDNDQNHVGLSSSCGQNNKSEDRDPSSSHGLRKRRKNSEYKQKSVDDSAMMTETCYAHKAEEEFAHVSIPIINFCFLKK